MPRLFTLESEVEHKISENSSVLSDLKGEFPEKLDENYSELKNVDYCFSMDKTFLEQEDKLKKKIRINKKMENSHKNLISYGKKKLKNFYDLNNFLPFSSNKKNSNIRKTLDEIKEEICNNIENQENALSKEKVLINSINPDEYLLNKLNDKMKKDYDDSDDSDNNKKDKNKNDFQEGLDNIVDNFINNEKLEFEKKKQNTNLIKKFFKGRKITNNKTTQIDLLKSKINQVNKTTIKYKSLKERLEKSQQIKINSNFQTEIDNSNVDSMHNKKNEEISEKKSQISSTRMQNNFISPFKNRKYFKQTSNVSNISVEKNISNYIFTEREAQRNNNKGMRSNLRTILKKIDNVKGYNNNESKDIITQMKEYLTNLEKI